MGLDSAAVLLSVVPRWLGTGWARPLAGCACGCTGAPWGHWHCHGVTVLLFCSGCLVGAGGYCAGSRLGSPPMCWDSLGRQVRSLEAHMYPEKLKVIAQQVQLQQQQEQVRLLHQEKLEREQQIRTQVSLRMLPGL